MQCSAYLGLLLLHVVGRLVVHRMEGGTTLRVVVGDAERDLQCAELVRLVRVQAEALSDQRHGSCGLRYAYTFGALHDGRSEDRVGG